MAELTEGDRAETHAEIMRVLSDLRLSIGITKQELRAAIDAIDTAMDGLASTINAAIPQPARSTLTTTQKALLLMYVIQKRYVKGA